MLSAKLLQNLLVAFVVLLLIAGLSWATVAGTRSGKSAVILHDVAALKDGLQYFLADQNRYPTSIEFQDRNIMSNYLSNFPPQQISGGSCRQTYSYSSPSAKTFELAFCLPKAHAGFATGWNKLKQP